MDNKHPRKILKSPVAKRRSRLVPKDQKVTLERVLGLTATSNALVACDPNTSTVAYPAGCVVVLYNPKKNKQGHIFNVSKKTLTSLAFSCDGKHLVTGESGFQPAVRVWDVAEKTQVAEFHGHKFGVSCVAFSPNLKYIVSIGTQHDMQVNVWNWRTGSKVASNKVSSKVSAVSFSADGSYFVTVGMRHVKFWYLDSSKSKINSITLPLNGRNGILGDHRNNFFCDVASGTGSLEKSTFCVTQSGYLCQFNEKRQMEKWVELRSTCANAISVAGKYIFVGCANGIVRVFNSSTLHFVASLPRPHYLGLDIAAAVNPSQLNSIKDTDIRYPDTIAVQYDEEHNKVTCIYNDHSMYIWDVHDMKKIGKAWSFLYHSSCVYGVEVYPVLEPGMKPVLPPHSFFTCSSDDTIRIWNLDPHMAETATYKSNIYTHDLLKVMYMDPSLNSLCDTDYNPSGATGKTDTNYDDKNGIRSIRVSPDGQHLASGDRQGNVRIHELENLIEIKQIEAHESEVLCLEYSRWKNGPKLLASSSRDRLIHVFDMEQQYGLLQTLSDHSSSISAVKFTDTDNELKMISCGADKSILFRNLQQDPEFQFTLATHQVEKMTLYDMEVEPTHKFSAIACQDRNVRIYNIKTGKKKKEYKGSVSDDGTLLKMKLDPSGTYAVTSCSDKNLSIIDFYTGELQATMFGHSEIATDVRFMNDLRHLISTSGDGCIFVWRLPQDMTNQMQNRLQEMGQILPHLTNGSIKLDPLKGFKKDEVDGNMVPEREFFSPERALREMYPAQYSGSQNISNSPSPSPKDNLDFRFSISQLPSWAKKKFEDSGGDGTENKPDTDDDTGSGPAPRGRWAQRAEGQRPTIKTQDGKSVDVESGDRRRISYQGEFSSSQLVDARRETMVLNRPTTTPTNMPVIFDDMNNDDDDDDDDDEFLPVSSKTFVKQDTQEKSDVTWDDLYNFEGDDNDQDKTEIIYYPPSESDGSDTLASSYQVFDAGISSDRSSRQLRHSISMNSNPDADSETTDPVSLEDVDDEEDSMPSTPMDDIPKSQNREKFLKDTFENLSFTPELPTDKFVRGLDTLEKEISTNPAAGGINSRQSLSARFLSKSQAANLRNQGLYGNLQRQDNWFDSVQRRKDDMARNLDESRKMLMAMGWKQESPETEGDDPFTKPSTSPTSSNLDSTPTLQQVNHSELGNDDEPDDLVSRLREQPDPPPSPRTSKTLRRSWSNFDLPKSPIPEGKPIKLPTQKRLERSVSSSNFIKSRDHQQTPTSRTSLSSTTRPRTLPLDRSGGRVTLTDKSTNKSQGRVRKDTPTGPQPSCSRLSEFKKNSRLSTPNLNKVQVVSPEPRRKSAGSNLSKSKSNSMTNLLSDDEEQELTPRGTNRRPRSKWSTSKMTSFASVPNLLNPEDDGKLSLSSSRDLDLSERSKQDINDNVISNKTRTTKSPQVGNSTLKSSKRAASTSRLSGESKSSTDDKKGLNKRVTSSVTNLKTVGKVKDRDLMPPPAVTNVAKTKQETRFMKRAQQPRRKTTGTSELTFEEAKNILKGNSGILDGKKEKRSSSTSPSRNRSSLTSFESGLTGSDIGEITDPAILNTATEIELTAAEIRRKSSTSSNINTGLELEASPQDLPERDIPCERDTSRTHVKTANSAKSVGVKPHPLKILDNDIYAESKTSLRNSGVLVQDDEECPSPSVKERIARLNNQVKDTNRQQTPSPLRGRPRSGSPEWENSRQTSSIQINFSSPSSTSSCSSHSVSSEDKTETAGTLTMSTTSTSPRRVPANDESFQSGSQHLRDHIHHHTEGTSHLLSGGTVMSSSAQSLSPPSGLTSSHDSEGLSHHLSPGNHSNTSPRSVADTGLGSDTDLENSQTFRRDQLLTRVDPHSILLESLDQIQNAVHRMTQTFPQSQSFFSSMKAMNMRLHRMIDLIKKKCSGQEPVEESEDMKAVEIRRQCRERLPALIESLCNTVGITPSSNHGNNMTLVSRDSIDNLYQQITDMYKQANQS